MQIINRSESKYNGILQNSLIASHHVFRFNFIRNKEFNHSEIEMQIIWKRKLSNRYKVQKRYVIMYFEINILILIKVLEDLKLAPRRMYKENSGFWK